MAPALDDWAPEALGRHIGYLPQDVELFPGNVAQNIAGSRTRPMPRPARRRPSRGRSRPHRQFAGRLRDPCRRSTAAPFHRPSAAYRASASALSGPFLIVLDEPNSNLDAEGDEALTRAILGVRARGAIVIVVARRPSAIAGVDYILVMARAASSNSGPKTKS